MPAWLLIPDGPEAAGAARAATPRDALPASDGRDRQGRARRPGRQAQPALRDGAGPARLRRDRARLSQLRRVQDRRLQDGIRQRHDEGDLEQPAGRRPALRRWTRSTPIGSASSATRWAATTRSSRRCSSRGSRPSSRPAASTPSPTITRATSPAGRTRGTCPGSARRYRPRPGEGPLRLPRADRRPGPAGVLHQLAAARRQLRGRGRARRASTPPGRSISSSASPIAWPPPTPTPSMTFPPAIREQAYEFLDRQLRGELIIAIQIERVNLTGGRHPRVNRLQVLGIAACRFITLDRL